jgi:hypothetical protein
MVNNDVEIIRKEPTVSFSRYNSENQRKILDYPVFRLKFELSSSRIPLYQSLGFYVIFAIYLTTLSVTQIDGANGRMTAHNEIESCGRKRLWPSLRCYSSIRLDGLRKITKTLISIVNTPVEI